MNFVVFFSRAAGTVIFMISPPKRLKLTYTLAGLVQFAGYLFICLARIYPQQHKLILILAMVLFGLGRSVLIFPFMIISHFFDSQTEQHYLSVWLAITTVVVGLGNIFVFYLQANLQWTSCLIVIGLIFLCVTVLIQCIVPEVETET